MLRIATPDLKKISHLLSNGLCYLDEVIGPIYGKMGMGSETIHHKHGYNFNTLTATLEEIGFIKVNTYNHWETDHPNSGLFDDKWDDQSAAYLHGELISLNIQASKPL